jgi:DNA-binding CsgD family transcriptional regulator
MGATTHATRLQEIQTSLQNFSFSNTYEQTTLPQEIVENLIDGILILTEQKTLVYANDCAKRILRQLNQNGTSISLIPREIWHICQTLIDSRHLFPSQHWLIESKVFVDSSIVFNVRARWLKLETLERPCLLLSICDQYQYIKDVALEESQKFGLTSREKEIWLLHRANYTYKQIALELCITPNTVKKHMKNIHVKQKATFATQ